MLEVLEGDPCMRKKRIQDHTLEAAQKSWQLWSCHSDNTRYERVRQVRTFFGEEPGQKRAQGV
jgi:hypothetical protein